MGRIPLLMGVITAVVFSVIGYSLWTAEMWLWGGVCMTLGALRLAVLMRQVWFRLRANRDDED
jgi:hypothetical protein